MQKYQNSVASLVGRPVVGATVTVLTFPGLAAATIYSDNGISTQSNPITTDNNGSFSFYAADGRYSVTISGNGIVTQTISDILLEDPVSTLALPGAAATVGSTGPSTVQADLDARPASATLAASSGSSLVGFLQAGTGAVAETVQSEVQRVFRPEQFGAVGDGTTDDTTNFNKALAAARVLTLTPGKTYLVTALTASINNQVIIAHGATVKLKAGQASANMLTLSGNYQRVLGGEWDGNRANQTPSAFNYANIKFTGTYCEVSGTYVHDSAGIGIMGSGVDYCNVHHNQVADCYGYGIYADKTTADGYGNRITDNYVSNTSDTAACGIYFSGQNSPFTYKQHNWHVSGNTATGPTGTPTGVGITVRGVDGVCSGNSTDGFDIGLSCDITSRSSITGNRCFSPTGATGYCMEVNGFGNAITGNKSYGGKYSFSSSNTSSSASVGNDNTICGNNFEDPSVICVFINASGGGSALRLNISGNTIKFSAATAGQAVYLKGACQYSLISGNTLIGPGSATANTYSVYLDTVNSNVSITSNTLVGWQRAVACYNISATAYTDIAFHNNDCRQDVAGTPAYLAALGTATIGARCSLLWNKQNTTSDNFKHYFDFASLRGIEYSNNFASPASNVSAGIGSLYVSTIGGAATTFFVKESGTGNTGWAGK